MKKKLALAAASAVTLAVMAGPGALSVSAQDTDTDVRAEVGWMKHDSAFKGRGHAWGRLRLLGEAEHPRKDGEHRRGGLFGQLRDADLTAEQTAEVRAAVEAKHESVIEAMKAKMEARIAAMEARKDAVVQAWTIEDKDERNAALDEAHEAAKEDRAEIRTTFRASVKAAFDTFTAAIKGILGIES